MKNIIIPIGLLFIWSCGELTENSFKPDGVSENKIERVPTAERILYQNEADRTVKYRFDVGKQTHTIRLGFKEDDIKYYSRQPKSYTYRGSEPPADYEIDYYNMFLKKHRDVVILDEILEQIEDLKPNMTEIELLTSLVAFVQGGLAYDWDSYYDVNDKLNYPLETLGKSKGVCSDKSLVLGKLLALLGYDVVFMTFEKANHMAVGIRVPYGYGNLGTEYAFIETTNYSVIGKVPDKFVGGIQIDEVPNIIPVINSGNKIFEGIAAYQAQQNEASDKYGDYYNSASASEKSLLEEMDQLKSKIDQLKSELNEIGCKGTIPSARLDKCNEVHERVNRTIDKYNDKVNDFNALSNSKLQ